MKEKKLKNHWLIAIVVLAAGLVNTASAHLMVAQRGTLNFTDKGVYMVLSLPASAFASSDDNGDAQMQSSEFIKHRLDIIEDIKNNVVLFDDDTPYTVEGMMLTPVKDNDDHHQQDGDSSSQVSSNSDNLNIEQIIVMGRFGVMYSEEKKLFFEANLLGEKAEERKLTVVAKLADKSKIHEFKIKPGSEKIRLFARKL